MKPMKRVCIFCSALMVLLALEGCVLQSPRLEFSSGPCDESINPYETDMGIKDVTWVDDTTLVVTLYVNINCAEEITGGDFKIYGDKIILEYNSPECEACTFCLCSHKLTYKFTHLEKQDYYFELKRTS